MQLKIAYTLVFASLAAALVLPPPPNKGTHPPKTLLPPPLLPPLTKTDISLSVNPITHWDSLDHSPSPRADVDLLPLPKTDLPPPTDADLPPPKEDLPSAKTHHPRADPSKDWHHHPQ